VSYQQQADDYFAAMRAQDVAGLVALFAEDGTFIWPDGRCITGHAAIRATYERLFAMPGNNPVAGPLMQGPRCAAAEVHSRLPDGSARRTVNVFDFDGEGLITRMASYRRG